MVVGVDDGWYGVRVATFGFVAAFAIACGDDASSDDALTSNDGTFTSEGSSSAGSTSADGSTDGSASADSSSSGDASTNAGDDGEPLPDPDLQPGGCGWTGDAFGCGWTPSPAHLCAAGTMAGGSCETGEDLPCCLDDHTYVSCQCIDNACEPQWHATDCTHGPGAGACGWFDDAYVCGGSGDDPGGMAIECPRGVMSGFDCSALPLGTTCCDADGNAARCVSGNGGGYWEIDDCVF
jgi:hypothetical protein